MLACHVEVVVTMELWFLDISSRRFVKEIIAQLLFLSLVVVAQTVNDCYLPACSIDISSSLFLDAE